MGYSKAPEQPQSSARPICHSHTMWKNYVMTRIISNHHDEDWARTSHLSHCCIGARRATTCATGVIYVKTNLSRKLYQLN